MASRDDPIFSRYKPRSLVSWIGSAPPHRANSRQTNPVHYVSLPRVLSLAAVKIRCFEELNAADIERTFSPPQW